MFPENAQNRIPTASRTPPLWVSCKRLAVRATRGSLVVQTNHAGIGCFGIDLDGRIVSTRASAPSQVRGNLRSWKSATPASTLDGAQEVFDLGIECRWLFQIDGVASVGTDPQTRVGKSRFEH